MTAVDKSLDPVLIYEGDDEIELLVVQAKVNNANIRFINGYGPQEDDNRASSFFQKLEEEIEMAQDNDCLVMIEMDANSKLGWEIIKDDPNEKSANGDLLLGIIERTNLTVVNSLDLCQGTITRSTIKNGKKEESVLDYFLVCDQLLSSVEKMVVDEEKVHVLTKFATKKGVKTKVESDHNLLVCELNLKYKKSQEKIRSEIFNFCSITFILVQR